MKQMSDLDFRPAFDLPPDSQYSASTASTDLLLPMRELGLSPTDSSELRRPGNGR